MFWEIAGHPYKRGRLDTTDLFGLANVLAYSLAKTTLLASESLDRLTSSKHARQKQSCL